MIHPHKHRYDLPTTSKQNCAFPLVPLTTHPSFGSCCIFPPTCFVIVSRACSLFLSLGWVTCFCRSLVPSFPYLKVATIIQVTAVILLLSLPWFPCLASLWLLMPCLRGCVHQLHTCMWCMCAPFLPILWIFWCGSSTGWLHSVCWKTVIVDIVFHWRILHRNVE